MSSDFISVSVCVVTYNQENYIAECLESIVTQKTNFKFEIIVGEDCSTDNTRKIVQEYSDKYPNIIVPILYEKNVGPFENIKKVYSLARGKYIAHMDGDDLALPGKLQKQFNILEKNLDCNVCTHDCSYIDQFSNIVEGKIFGQVKQRNNFLDLLERLPFFAHSSKFFRVDLPQIKMLIGLMGEKVIDVEIHEIQARYGMIYHIDEVLGCYRENVGLTVIGGPNKLNRLIDEGVIRAFEGALTYHTQYSKEIRRMFVKQLLRTAYTYAVVENNKVEYKFFVKKALELKTYSPLMLFFLLGSFFPDMMMKLLRLRANRKYK